MTLNFCDCHTQIERFLGFAGTFCFVLWHMLVNEELGKEKVTILSCLVSAFSPPPLFSPRLGRFFRFFNESLHESCNRIKDILSSRSVCLMPSIESIGAISSLGGREIDSSCPWLVKGMSSGTIESLKLRNYRISQELNKLFYASGIGKHDKSVLHILASSLVFKERKL
ncbi:hypothetical protein L6452_32773 [Arctium lappa]|uniref:Uncharacterized protein n=1 Tax=Arctium lappa TaxID=4217 RepID=A0ACB8Z5X8_ARCLA|nr:hypothetical protein L6452_32773 [Arctium lappa]